MLKSLCPHAGGARRSRCFRSAIVGNYAAAGLVYDVLQPLTGVILLNRKKTVSLAEREGLQSVIDNARKHAEAGYPDFTECDPATFDADFVINKEREGMSIAQALEALVAFKRSQH